MALDPVTLAAIGSTLFEAVKPEPVQSAGALPSVPTSTFQPAPSGMGPFQGPPAGFEKLKEQVRTGLKQRLTDPAEAPRTPTATETSDIAAIGQQTFGTPGASGGQGGGATAAAAAGSGAQTIGQRFRSAATSPEFLTAITQLALAPRQQRILPQQQLPRSSFKPVASPNPFALLDQRQRR